LIEAYVTVSGGGYAFPFGVYDDDRAVGFVMVGYGTDENWKNPPKIATKNYSLWRLMIDQREQNKGYGKAALQLALDFIRKMPCGKADYCWLSYEPTNYSAKNLYYSFGFRETGEMDHTEVIAALRLEIIPLISHPGC